MRTTKVVLIFFSCGLAAGACFGGLLSIPSLLTFWFHMGDKFLIPTYRYYLGIGLFLLLGLAPAYSVSRTRGWVAGPLTKSVLRQGSAALIILMSALLAFAVIVLASQIFFAEVITWYLAGTIVFALLISVACWVLTSNLYYPGVLANLLTIPVAIGLLYLLAKAVRIPAHWRELVTYPFYDSLLAAACGFWVVRTNQRPRLKAD